MLKKYIITIFNANIVKIKISMQENNLMIFTSPLSLIFDPRQPFYVRDHATLIITFSNLK